MVAYSQSRRGLNKTVYRAGQLLSWVAIAVALAVSWLNVQPFMAFVLWAFPAKDNPVVKFFLSLPGIGNLFSQIGGLLAALAGVAIWAAIILIEIMPELLRLNQEDVKKAVDEYRSHDGNRLEAREEDPGVIQSLVEWHNNLPAQWIKDVFAMQSFAFLIDFVASFIYYYPLKTDLQIFMASPSIADVDWLLISTIVLCVFTASIIVRVIRITDGGLRSFKGSAK